LADSDLEAEMFEFFRNIGTLLQGVGLNIAAGFKDLIGFLGTNIVTPVVDFVKKIPGMVRNGFGYVQEFVSGIFSGDLNATGQAANSATGGLGYEVYEDAATSLLSMGGGGSILNDLGGLMPDAAKTAAKTATSGISGGAPVSEILINGPAPGSLSALGSTSSGFAKIMDFFKTDAGSLIGSAGKIGLAMMYEKQKTNSAMKAAQAEARRQEEEKRRNFLIEQQRAGDIMGWQAQRANEEAQFGARNKFAGFGAGWSNPTAAPPAPTLEIRQ
jgi:hypothetical protein